MTKGNLINNTKTRRKGSMLQDSLSKIKYLVVLAFLLAVPMLLAIPMKANAGFPNDLVDQTDTGANRLIYYYDELGRHTYIQVTNTSDSFVGIHVQVFEADNNCNEVDFDDCLTPGDTNVYDMEALPGLPDLTDSNGFVSVSIDNTIGCGKSPSYSLIGMFRILDSNGYEYRTNAADTETEFTGDELAEVLNFNDVTGNQLSDVVGITYVPISSNQVYASPFIGTVFGTPSSGFQNLIFDENENPNSCSPTLFTCDNNNTGFGGYINKGIDNSIPNSQGFPSICNTSKLTADNDAGWLYMPWFNFVCQDNFVCDGADYISFVGYLGLNNGDGTGSMDSFLTSEYLPLAEVIK